MSTLSQFVGGSPIKSIQRGTITLTGGVDTSKSATISSVDTSKSVVNALGGTVTANTTQGYFHRFNLSGSTSVTANRYAPTGDLTVSYEVIEYN